MSRTELAQSGPMGNEGQSIRERREQLKLNKVELARESAVHRDTITDIEAGKGFQAATMGKLIETLDRLEDEAGLTAAGEARADAGLVRYTVQNVYGATAIVVEGSVENIAELEASVDRIMRRAAGQQTPAPAADPPAPETP